MQTLSHTLSPMHRKSKYIAVTYIDNTCYIDSYSELPDANKIEYNYKQLWPKANNIQTNIYKQITNETID